MALSECLLVKTGPEIALKSSYVRRDFIRRLENNLHDSARNNSIKIAKIERSGGRLFLYSEELDNLQKIIANVFGVQSYAKVVVNDFTNLEDICAQGVEFVKSDLKKQKTFAIRAARSGTHKITSKEIEIAVGDAVRTKFGLKVNLSKPEYVLNIELREKKSYLYSSKKPGLVGLPLGTAGAVAIFCSEKNESLLAAFLMMRRGCRSVMFSKNAKLARECAEKLQRFNSSFSVEYFSIDEFGKAKTKNKIGGVVFSKNEKPQVAKELAVLYPLQFYPAELKKQKLEIINS